MWRRRLLAGVCVTVVVVASACQWIVGIGNAHLADGGGDGGLDPCAMPNVPPAPVDAAPPGTMTFVGALSQITLGSTDAGPWEGFNLDGKCTCEGTPPGTDSCTRGSTQDAACDDPAGVDNYARRIFEQINTFTDGGIITEAKLNFAIQSGLSGALIEVDGYNGQQDDPQVTVTVYGSVGYENYPTAPAFDGGDRWFVDPLSASKAYTTSNAYIAKGTLVAAMDFPIIIGSAFTQPVYIQLKNGYITAQITTDGSGNITKLTGMLGGRWDPSAFLPSLQVVPDPVFSGQYLCGSDPTYQILKSVICGNLDVNIDPSIPGPCNAVSMGLGFEATPAQVGSTKFPPDAALGCGPTWKDNCPPPM